MKHVREFTEILSQLLQTGLSMKESLDQMRRMAGSARNSRLAAEEIGAALAEGSLLSVAFRKCTAIAFSGAYVACIASAEQAGNLAETFRFLDGREQAQHERNGKLALMSAYPLFVAVLACAGSFLLRALSGTLIPGGLSPFDCALYERKSLQGMVTANGVLLLGILLLGCILRRLSLGHESADAFRIMHFLIKAGSGLRAALESGALVFEHDRKTPRRLLSALQRLEHGERASRALEGTAPQAALYLELAEQSGSLEKAFGQISVRLRQRQEQHEKLYLSLVEPSVMALLGVYIIILLKTIVAPVLFAFNA